MRMVYNKPKHQVRNVLTGMVGSSMLATEARTSGYGDSLRNCQSKHSTNWGGSTYSSKSVKSDILEVVENRVDSACDSASISVLFVEKSCFPEKSSDKCSVFLPSRVSEVTTVDFERFRRS